MKKLILIAAAWMVAVGAFAQGQFLFTNRDAASGVDARFIAQGDAPGTSSIGAGYNITLFGGPAGGTLAQIGTDTFRSTPAAGIGYVLPITVTVPTVASAGAADIKVVVTDANGNQLYSQIFNKNAAGTGAFTLGGDTITPPTLPMGTVAITLVPVPEPTTLALAGLGLGALLMIRRRR